MNSRLLALIFTFVTYCFFNVSIAQEKHKGYSPMQITSISPSAILPSKGDKPKRTKRNEQSEKKKAKRNKADRIKRDVQSETKQRETNKAK